MPADILGQVYERFLGKVIEIGEQGLTVEEKPEVKKAGGIFYTPEYIVDYIVKNTVGRLLEDKKPDSAAKIKILDPACGSGAFLINAYQCLLDRHLDWYKANTPEKHTGKNKPLMRDDHGAYRLSHTERKKILLIPICIRDDTMTYTHHGGVPCRDKLKSVLKTYKEPSNCVIKP